MRKMESFTIRLSKETVSDIEGIVTFENSKNLLWKLERKSDNTREDFRTGCVNYYIEQIKEQDSLFNIGRLGESRPLKNKLKEYLQAHGISQASLCKTTGISAPNISQIVNNTSQPSLDYFFRIWVALSCPPLKEIFYREKV